MMVMLVVMIPGRRKRSLTHRQSAERVVATMLVGMRVGMRMPRMVRLVRTASASPQIRIRRQTLKEVRLALIASGTKVS